MGFHRSKRVLKSDRKWEATAVEFIVKRVNRSYEGSSTDRLACSGRSISYQTLERLRKEMTAMMDNKWTTKVDVS